MKHWFSFKSLFFSGFAMAYLVAHGAGPTWWNSRAVIDPGLAPDDFAVANQGQLKNIAYAAYVQMDADYQTVGGAGSQIGGLVSQWSNTQGADDYAVVTVGQLRALALPFYQRLVALEMIPILPDWLSSSTSENYAVANQGQVKRAFSFAVATDLLDPEADSDGDGIANGLEFALGLSTLSADSDGDGIEDAKEDFDQDGIENLLDESQSDEAILAVTITRPLPSYRL